MFAGSGLAEEGVEGVVAAADGLVGGHLAVRLDTVLQAVQLPAGIADLDTGLANVDGDALTLWTYTHTWLDNDKCNDGIDEDDDDDIEDLCCHASAVQYSQQALPI